MKYIHWVIWLVVLYFGASFYHGVLVTDTVQELIESNLDGTYKVEQVNLSGYYLIDHIRPGVVLVYKEDELLSINIKTMGNGLWEQVYVEIPAEEVFKLSLGKLGNLFFK